MTYFNLKPVQDQKGVYILYTKDELAYVGKSSNILRRLQQHFYITEKESSTELWKKDIDKVEYYICESLADCELLETYLINTLTPKYNLDKVYPDKLTLVISSLPQKYELAVLELKIRPRTVSFKGIMVEYCNLVDNVKNLDLEFVNSRRFTLERLAQEILSLDIKEIVKKVGTKRIRTLNYSKIGINKELYSNCDEVKNVISEAIYNKLEKNTFYSTAQIKQVLGKIYKDFKIEKTPKAVELDKYCSIRKVSRTVENKLIKGVFIL